jgi:hypothetical protein
MSNKGYSHPLAIKSEADLRPSLERRDKYLNTWLNTYVPAYNDNDSYLYTQGGIVLPTGTVPVGDDDVVSFRALRSVTWQQTYREVRYTSGNWYAYPKGSAVTLFTATADRIYMAPIVIGGVGNQTFTDFGFANTTASTSFKGALYYYDKDGLPGDMVPYSAVEYTGGATAYATKAFANPDPLTDAIVLAPGVYWGAFIINTNVSWQGVYASFAYSNFQQWYGGHAVWSTAGGGPDQAYAVHYYYSQDYADDMPDPFPSVSLWSEVASNIKFRFGLKAS